MFHLPSPQILNVQQHQFSPRNRNNRNEAALPRVKRTAQKCKTNPTVFKMTWEQHSVHLNIPHLHISHIKVSPCQHGVQAPLSPGLSTLLLTHCPYSLFVVLLRKKKRSLGANTSLPAELYLTEVFLQADQSPSPYQPNPSCSWITAEITSRTCRSQASSRRACQVGQVCL